MSVSKIRRLNNYVDLGWKVFPVFGIHNGYCLCGHDKCKSPGKHPRTHHGFKDATDNLNTIEGWHKKYPNANWAVRTGSESGVFVIDVDVKSDGIVNWLRLVKENTKEYLVPFVRTPSGGSHYYFKMPNEIHLDNSTGSLPDGIDIRANGGYVLLPTVSKDYINLESFNNIKPPPNWLIKILTKENSPSSEPMEPIIDKSKQKIIECEMPSGKIKIDVGWADEYIRNNIFDPVSGWDLYNKEFPELNWAIPNFLPVGLTLLAGYPKIGKSWLALQIAKAVASGNEFFSQKATKGRVLFLALEDNARRIQHRLIKQRWSDEGMKNIDFYFTEDFRESIGYLHIEGCEKIEHLIESNGYRLVVIDTFPLSIFGNQNEYEAMTKAINPIQQTALNNDCSILGIEHHKKMSFDKRDVVLNLQGSIGKSAKADTVMGLFRGKKSLDGYLKLKGRDIEERSMTVTFDVLTGTWIYKGEEGDINMTGIRQSLLEAVNKLQVSQIKQIAEEVGMNKGHAHQELELLANAEKIIKRNKQGNVFYFPYPKNQKEHEAIENLFRECDLVEDRNQQN